MSSHYDSSVSFAEYDAIQDRICDLERRGMQGLQHIAALESALACTRMVVRDLVEHHDRLAQELLAGDDYGASGLIDYPMKLAERVQYEMEMIDE